MTASGKQLSERQKKSKLKASVREWRQRKREYEAIQKLKEGLEQKYKSTEKELTKFVVENFGVEPFLVKIDKNKYRIGIDRDRIWGDSVNIERLLEK